MWDDRRGASRTDVSQCEATAQQAGAMSLVLARIWRGLWLLAVGAVLCLSLAGRAAYADDTPTFLPPEQAFAFGAQMHGKDQVDVRLRIADGYYLYRSQFKFALSPDRGVTLGAPVFPAGTIRFDPTFNRNEEVYFRAVDVLVPVAGVSGDTGASVTLTVTSQGCAVAGVCYPPAQHTVQLRRDTQGAWTVTLINGQPPELANAAAQGRSLSWKTLFDANDVGLASVLGGLSVPMAVALFFALGILLALTPCVLPMVPILANLVAGGTRAGTSRWRGLALAAMYVLGMSLVYTALGVAAGLSGAGLAAWLQQPWVLTLFALLLTLLALASFGAFTLQTSSGWQSGLTALSMRLRGGRVLGVFVMGAISALIVGPCVAAPLAGVLLYISQTGNAVFGALALFALAWGMGVPLLLVGAACGAWLPRVGPWMASVRRLFGVLLLATAWWMVLPLIAPAPFQMGWAALAMLAAVLLGAFEPLESLRMVRVLRKTAGLLVAAAAVWLLWSALGGTPSSLGLSSATGADPSASRASVDTNGPATDAPALAFEPIHSVAQLDAALAAAHAPVMLDFYADWCVSCREMERFTYPNPDVYARMAKFVRLRADVTANDADDRALLRRFHLFGPPGVIFFTPDGNEAVAQRVVGYTKAPTFTRMLDAVLAQSPTSAPTRPAGASSSLPSVPPVTPSPWLLQPKS